MENKTMVKSTQEQASAAWISYLNQARLNELTSKLVSQDNNLRNALTTLQNVKITISDEIINRNRGGIKGMHGFIAEVAEVAFENASDLVEGVNPKAVWVNDNGPVDIMRGSVLTQQKFVKTNGHFSLGAIKEHLTQYPDFLDKGNKYQIPKDFYEKIRLLLKTSPAEAAKLTNNSGDEITYSNWKYVQKFFKESGVRFQDLEPARLDYSAAQTGNIEKTIQAEIEKTKNTDKEIRDQAYNASKPSVAEGFQATAVSAVLEGGITFCLGVKKKLKEGKTFHSFTTEDWKELGVDTAKGTGVGAVRGATVYVLSNYTATPAPVASSLVTATFGIITQATKLRKGELTPEDFIINSEVVCLETAVSAVSSLLGECVIPIPVLGAIVGNAVGMLLYGLAKEYLTEKEQFLIVRFRKEIECLNRQLDERYKSFVENLKQEFERFASILEWAFDPDINKAFEGSIHLAKHLNVAEDKILQSISDVNKYFLS